MQNRKNVVAVCCCPRGTTADDVSDEIRIDGNSRMMLYNSEMEAVREAFTKSIECMGQMPHVAVEFEVSFKPVAVLEFRDGYLVAIPIDQFFANRNSKQEPRIEEAPEATKVP